MPEHHLVPWVSASDSVIQSLTSWKCSQKLEKGQQKQRKGDRIKIAEETREREGERKRRKGGRRRVREGATDFESERTSHLEPRQIALEGYLLKYLPSADEAAKIGRNKKQDRVKGKKVQ